MRENKRTHITIEDDQGNCKDYSVEGLFDMRDESYALLKSGNEMMVMKIEEENGQQFLSEIRDSIEREAIIDTYQIVVQNEYEQLQRGSE